MTHQVDGSRRGVWSAAIPVWFVFWTSGDFTYKSCIISKTTFPLQYLFNDSYSCFHARCRGRLLRVFFRHPLTCRFRSSSFDYPPSISLLALVRSA
ncbi:hypothetical protein BC628DRAFT_1359697 [Trametes gibbosa]|nr:hypothetical protein BC628DRAFT_1359697 [Trametes gibbosa]